MDQTTSASRWPLWILLLGLAAYAWWLWPYEAVLPGGSDSSGYFNTAKLLATGRVHAAMRPIAGLPPADMPAYLYTPLGFMPEAKLGRLTPTYPIGLPLCLMVFIPVFGVAKGANLVLLLHALAGAGLIYALGRALGLKAWAALLGTAMLALSPLYLLYSLQAMSDVPATVWVLAAILLAWRSEGRLWMAGLTGLALGLAVLMRPTNIFAALPVLIALGWGWRRWLALALGGLPCAVALLWFNHAAYGSALASGYGDITELLSWRWVGPALRHYAIWLPVIGTPLVVAVVAWPWVRSPLRLKLVLAAWLLPWLVFYAFYYHTHETWWYLRFILPVLPALILAALLALQAGVARVPYLPARWLLLVLLCAVALRSQRYWGHQWNITDVAPGERVYFEASVWAREHLPADAVIIAMQTTGALYYHTDFCLLRWDSIDSEGAAVRAGLHAAGRPAYGIFFDFEEKPAMEEKLPGRWTKVAQVRQASVWRYEPVADRP